MLGSRTHWLRVSEDEPAEPSLPASGDQAASSRPLGLALTPAVGAGGTGGMIRGVAEPERAMKHGPPGPPGSQVRCSDGWLGPSHGELFT